MTAVTERQLAFIEKLAQQRNLRYDVAEVRKMDLDEASRLIDWLLKKEPPKQEAKEGVERGTYKYNDAMYIIRKSKTSERLYAARVITYGYNRVRTTYAPGVYSRLSPEMRITLSEAREFGMAFGVCCMCGRKLTDPESINNGIGPVCAGRYF